MEINSLLDFSQYISKDVLSVFALNPNGNTRQSIAHEIGISQTCLAIPEQVHSVGVKWVDAPGKYSGIDGLITSKTNLILSLKVADCVPVYLFEPQKNIAGLVHSGWRGTVGGIISNSIELMQKKGADKGLILVYMGPAIGNCCYEVDAEVADNFDKKSKRKLENGKWRVGLHEQIYLQLTEMDIPSTNIKFTTSAALE